jgi:Alginate export
MKPQVIFSATLIILITVFAQSTLFAQKDQEELKINIQLRPRAEFRNGLFTPILEGQKPASFVAQRSRIGLTYSKNQKLKMGISTQVVHTWGNDPQVQTTANDISLYEAWGQLHFSPEWNIKLGRQVFSYDDERILGALDWNNAARKHDAGLLGFEKNKFRADLAVAFNQNAEKINNTFYNDSLSQPYKGMQFLWMKYKFTDAFAISVLAMNLDMQSRADSSLSYLQTLGGNAFYKKDRWNAMATYYYQTGNKPVKNFNAIKTNAWMASAQVDYNINKNLNAGIGSDYLSGKDMNASSSRVTYFNPLYGTGHKFYGFMDYFYVSSAHKNVGLWDSYINLNLKATEDLSWQIALHHFEAAAKVIDYSGSTANANLGNELDLTFNYKVMKDVKLSGGYSQMFTNTSMKYVKNIAPNQTMKDFQNWVWLSININPEIFLLKSK